MPYKVYDITLPGFGDPRRVEVLEYLKQNSDIHEFRGIDRSIYRVFINDKETECLKSDTLKGCDIKPAILTSF